MNIKFKTWNCSVERTRYIIDSHPALVLVDPVTHETIARCTVWLPGLLPDEVAIKDYSENEGMVEALVEGGVIQPPHRTQASGFVDIPICRLA